MDFEWLVIDGASDDGSIEFLNRLNENYISEPDHGIYDAMNKGLKHVKGDYILFLNAGDVLAESGTLSIIKTKILERPHPPLFIYGDSFEERPLSDCIYKPSRSIRTISYGMFAHHQAMMYANIPARNLFFNTTYKIAADYDFTLRFVQTYLKGNQDVLRLSLPVCIFEAGGVSQQHVRAGRREQFMIRMTLKSVSLPLNVFIYAAQTLAMRLRQISPSLYWRLRRQG